jgi:AP2 domain
VAAYAKIDPRAQWLTRYPWYRLTRDGVPVTFAHPAAPGRPATMAEVVLDIVGQEGVAAEHRNGDPLDNRGSNLRVVASEPGSQGAPAHRRSAYRGVLWDAAQGSWAAYGVSGGTYVDLGRFDDELAAARAAREWAVENQSIHLEDDHRAGGFGRALGPPRAPHEGGNGGRG